MLTHRDSLAGPEVPEYGIFRWHILPESTPSHYGPTTTVKEGIRRGRRLPSSLKACKRKTGCARSERRALPTDEFQALT